GVRIADACRWGRAGDPGGEASRSGRSNRLRRRVSRGASLRDRQRLGLGAHRAARLAPRVGEDRLAWWPESHRRAREDRGPVPGALWTSSVLSLLRRARSRLRPCRARALNATPAVLR